MPTENIMDKSNKVYPEWVQKFRTRGTTIKKVGDTYYLYKRTSKRIPGKKNPQSVDTYIGIITPDGVKETKVKKISTAECIVKEYGFSYVLEKICPDDWKRAVGDGWKETLYQIIYDKSPNSYLLKNQDMLKEAKSNIGAQISSLNRRLQKQYGVDIKRLILLKEIYIVYLGKQQFISKISQEQEELLKLLEVNDMC